MRKQWKGKKTGPSKKMESVSGPVHRFEGSVSDKDKNLVTVHCKQDYQYSLNEAAQVPDHFSKIFEENAGKMQALLAPKKIPFVQFLQPNLGLSIAQGAVDEVKGKQILIKGTGMFMKDWIHASHELYPRARQATFRLREKGIRAYDFSGIFDGDRLNFYSDAVHSDSPEALDCIAAEVEKILVAENVLPSG